MKQIGNLNFSVTDKWNEGFTGSISFDNQADDLKGWTIEFDAPFAIYEIWGGEIVSHSGNHYVIKNADWNQSLKWGEKAKFGFNANNNSSTITNPSNFTFEKQSVPATLSNQYLDLDNGTIDNSVDTGNPDNGSTDSPVDTDNSGATEVVNPDNGNTDNSGAIEVVNVKGNGQFRYGEAIQKSYLFYEAQRSGDLPSNNRIEWRADTGLNDGSDVGRDLSGGYYDAGDHMKFGLPMAYSTTVLAWGVEEYQDAYAKSGQLDEALAAVKWSTDYFLKGIVTDGDGVKEFYGQIGNSEALRNYWGSHEDLTIERPAYKIDRENPGSDLAAETAASLAAASMIFRATDSVYADILLANARQLYDFAERYKGKYSDSITSEQRKSSYESYGYGDELSWGASWLYKASGDSSYLNKAESYYQEYIGYIPTAWTLDWETKSHGAAVLLAQETGKSEYKNEVEKWLNSWVDGNNGVQLTSGGLAFASGGNWASLRYSANTAFLAGVYSDNVADYNNRYADFAESQVDYILGDNPRNSSYMVGFGDNSPQQPHHQTAHGKPGWDAFNNDTNPNEHILYGALVGGPRSADDFDYEDKRTDYVGNEVTLDYNAGLTGALAYMYDKFGGEALSNSELNDLPGIVVADF